MTPDHQRIAIAEACGWTVTHWKVKPFDVIATKDGTEYQLKHLPDYLKDLNAMHEAEKILTALQRADYAHELLRLVAINQPYRPKSMSWCHLDFFQVAHATAAQRAEAFLRTIGKWEESK